MALVSAKRGRDTEGGNLHQSGVTSRQHYESYRGLQAVAQIIMLCDSRGAPVK